MLYPKQIQFVVIYTIVVMTLFCVPSYFALSSTINEEKQKATQEILEWIDKKEKTIFTENCFSIPKSVRFKTAIYNAKHEVLYSDLATTFDRLDFKAKVIYPYLYYQKEIKTPKNKLFHLVVEVQINYAKIIFMTTILFFTALFLIFLMSSLFVNTTIYPYKKMQSYMNDFFNDSMHELKTPLGVISINLELMGQYVTQGKHIQRIKAATKQMQMTYEDVEYYIKNQKMQHPKEQINLSEYLMSRIHFFEDLAFSKSIVMTPSIQKDIEIYFNRVELQRIIDNTLSNAIKYSFFKSIVEISLIKKDDLSAILSIKDYGQGIKDINKVFQRFKREDMVQGGFGLGLNIVQNICEKNGVKISIDSAQNKGSVFFYSFTLFLKKGLV